MYTTTELFGRIQTSKRRLSVSRQDLRRLPRCDLEALCARKLPAGWDALNPRKANSRQRIYTPKITTLTFLSQVLSPGSSCREAVRQVQGISLAAPGQSRRWHLLQSAGHSGEPRVLSAIERPAPRVRISVGADGGHLFPANRCLY